jgi:Lon protease-like protein
MELPLFPLNTVLCPGIALPLHIFEPRYRLLTDRCVAASSPFGVVLIREGHEVGDGEVSIAAVGTFAEIREAGRYPDGRYDLLVVGAGRFAIQSIDSGQEPYLVAEVDVLDDRLGDPSEAASMTARTMRRFVAYLRLLQPLDGEAAEAIDVRVEVETEVVEADEEAPGGTEAETTRRLVIPDDPTVLAHLLSGIIQVDAGQRQVLLEAPTTVDRLRLLDEVLDRELWMLRRRLRHYAPDLTEAAARRN